MDDLYLDGEFMINQDGVHRSSASYLALGIAEEVEQLGLKGSKKKKSKKLDEDYLVNLSLCQTLFSLSHRPSSLPSSRSWRRTFQRSYKQCVRHKVARCYSSC